MIITDIKTSPTTTKKFAWLKEGLY